MLFDLKPSHNAFVGPLEHSLKNLLEHTVSGGTRRQEWVPQWGPALKHGGACDEAVNFQENLVSRE